MAKAVVRRRRYFPRRRTRSKHGMTIPLAVVGGFAPLVVHEIAAFKAGGIANAATQLALRTTGYNYADGGWYPTEMVRGVGPILLGALVHKVAGRLGINRALAGAGIPFVRI